LKIALCVSGETRTFNENFDCNVLWLAQELRTHNIEVDIFGHTWDYCDLPKNTDAFKKIEVGNKTDIKNWITDDFLARIVQYNHYDFYNDLPRLSLTKSEKYTDAILESSIAGWSQIWSAFCSFSLINDVEDYDYIIRWRWDARFGNRAIPNGNTGLVNYLQSILFYHLTTPNAVVLNDKTPDIYFSGNSFINIDIKKKIQDSSSLMCIEDTFFVIPLRNNLFSKDIINKLNWKQKIDGKVRLKSVNNRNCSHTLWYDVFQGWDLLGYFMLPDCARLERKVEKN
jgi:hypothetical protein